MTEKRTVPDPASDEESLQRRFDEAARELDFKLEPRAAERATVGVAVVALQPEHPLVEVTRAAAPRAAPGTDEEDIGNLVQTWEAAHPDELVATWRTLATEPFVAVSSAWVAPLSLDEIDRVLRSPDSVDQMAKFPFYKPRRLKVGELRIVSVGPTKAVATYNVQEDYQDGQVFAGNAAMVLINDASGAWKVAVYVKHTRFDDFVPLDTGKR